MGLSEETYEQIETYLKGLMDKTAREAFEKELADNQELAKEVAFQRSLFDFGKKEMAKDYVGEILKEVIKPPVVWWQNWRVYANVAAVLIILLVASSIRNILLPPKYPDSLSVLEQEQMVVEHYTHSGLLDLTSAKDTLIYYLKESKGGTEEALILADNLVESDSLNAQFRIIRGLFLIQHNEVEKALKDWHWIFNNSDDYENDEVCITGKMIFETLYRDKDNKKRELIDFQKQWEKVKDYSCFEEKIKDIPIKKRISTVLSKMQEDTQ